MNCVESCRRFSTFYLPWHCTRNYDNIDENCVVGWATAYFHMVVKGFLKPNLTKSSWATAYFHMVVKESEECVDECISCRTAQNPQFAQISSIFRVLK